MEPSNANPIRFGGVSSTVTPLQTTNTNPPNLIQYRSISSSSLSSSSSSVLGFYFYLLYFRYLSVNTSYKIDATKATGLTNRDMINGTNLRTQIIYQWKARNQTAEKRCKILQRIYGQPSCALAIGSYCLLALCYFVIGPVV